jgi:hypothetical protein
LLRQRAPLDSRHSIRADGLKSALQPRADRYPGPRRVAA